MSETHGSGPNGGAGYGAPFLPYGRTETVTAYFYNWWDASGPGNFLADAANPAFADIISNITVNVEPDAITAGVVPQLQTLFANLPCPAGKKYYFCVNAPLMSLSLPSYGFATRTMVCASYDGRAPESANVPLLNAEEGPAITAYVCGLITALMAIFAAAGPNFVFFAFGGTPTSSIYFDFEFVVPSANGLTSAEDIAAWATYGVTEASVAAFLASHFAGMAAGPGADLFLTMPYLHPDATSVGSYNDGGVSYYVSVQGIVNSLFALAKAFLVNDQSLSGRQAEERSNIIEAANYAGAYVCQITGNTNGPALIDTVNYAVSRAAVWIEIGGTTKDGYPSHLTQLIAAGWNGSSFGTVSAGGGGGGSLPLDFGAPVYDVIAAIDTLAPGVVLQQPILDGCTTAWSDGGYVPLTQGQVVAVTGPLPPYPTGLPRFPDSNPAPDGWCTYGNDLQ